MKKVSIFLICYFSVLGFAKAEALIDIGATYSGDTFTTASASTSTQYFYNFSALFNLDRRMTWNLGWTFFGISQTNSSDGVSTNYASLDMGPALRWNIDKAGIFSLTAAYGYLSKGTFSSGSTSENWEGGSLLGQFAIQAPIKEEKFYIGLSFNYYAATYTKKVVSSVESSNDAQKSWIFPMLSLTWRP